MSASSSSSSPIVAVSAVCVLCFFGELEGANLKGFENLLGPKSEAMMNYDE